MNLLNDGQNLKQMERILLQKMQDEENDFRIVGDLNLSKEDYVILVKKLKSLMENRDNLTVLEEYKFSLVVALVFALSYEDIKKIDNSYISYVLYPYPQHHEKYIIRAFEWAFEEYYINTYGIRVSTIHDVLELMVLHIGIPLSSCDTYFELVDRSFKIGSLHPEDTISEDMPEELRKVVNCVNVKRTKEISKTSRDIYYDYKVMKLPQNEILKKYPWYSLYMMYACFSYCDRHTEG